MRVYLKKEFFGDREILLVENGKMKAKAFRYSTGIEAIKVENEKGYFIILPFKGQQIWRVHFLGRDLHMRTMMEEPTASQVYLRTYGAFLLHCGIAAFGSPGKEDTHPQHGEIPNVEYQTAYIECGADYIAVGGRYDYDESFIRNYSFSPQCRLYEGETVLKIHVELENRRSKPMEYMYLCHINFRPEDGAELIYSADYTKDVKVHKVIGGNLPEEQAKALSAYMDEVERDPKLHHKIGETGQIYDPEICFTVRYKGDENKRAYTMQYMEAGACYVNHPVDVLPYGIRWISRTGDEDSMGMVLPATAEHFGYTYAKNHGQIKYLPGKTKIQFHIEAGYLEGEQARQMAEKVKKINANLEAEEGT